MPKNSSTKSTQKPEKTQAQKIWQVIGGIALAFVILAIVVVIAAASISNSPAPELASADYVQVVSEDSGNLAEKVIGDPETASLVIYEYADYGCSHCSEWNEIINAYVEENPEQIAVIFRSFDLGFTNGSTAAKAATAAQIQGYWVPYKDLLYENQSKWSNSSLSASDAEDLFVQYFAEVSGGQGDLEKFRADLNSDAVAKRLEFESDLAKEIGIEGTPTFRIDGKTIDLNKLQKTIESRLNQ